MKAFIKEHLGRKSQKVYSKSKLLTSCWEKVAKEKRIQRKNGFKWLKLWCVKRGEQWWVKVVIKRIKGDKKVASCKLSIN